MIQSIRRLAKAIKLLKNPAYRHALRHGVAAAIEHEDALRDLPIAALLDVGANVGQFSALARGLHPRVVIHAFEPLAESARTYRAAFAGQDDVHLHEIAAGHTNGEAVIHLAHRRDSSSLLPITERQTSTFPGTEEIGTRCIQVAKLDDILANAQLPKPLMIKLDVQGFELAALKGMPELLSIADYVYVEVSFVPLYLGQPLADEVLDWLAKRHYKLRGIFNLARGGKGETIQADLLLARAEGSQN